MASQLSYGGDRPCNGSANAQHEIGDCSVDRSRLVYSAARQPGETGLTRMATGRSPSFAEGGLTTVGGAATPGPMRAQWSVVWDASVVTEEVPVRFWLVCRGLVGRGAVRVRERSQGDKWHGGPERRAPQVGRLREMRGQSNDLWLRKKKERK